jgi:hypothetical protein
MHNEPLRKLEDPRQTPWNKGKSIGSKPPLRTKDVLVDPDQASGGRSAPEIWPCSIWPSTVSAVGALTQAIVKQPFSMPAEGFHPEPPQPCRGTKSRHLGLRPRTPS